MGKKTFTVELSTDNPNNIDATEVHLALIKYFVGFVYISVEESPHKNVKQKADNVCPHCHPENGVHEMSFHRK